MTVTSDADDGDAATTTLAVLEGAVSVQDLQGDGDEGVRLVSGEAMDVTGRHAVTTVSATPSCYVYAATSASASDNDDDDDDSVSPTADNRSSPTARGHDDDDSHSVSRTVRGGHDRNKKLIGTSCSDACYAFAFDAIKDAFSALFS